MNGQRRHAGCFGRYRAGRLSYAFAILAAAVMAALLQPVSASAAECTDTWKGAAEGPWTTGSNWTTGKVPTAADVACIGPGKTVTVGNPATVAGLQVEGTLKVVGVTLTVNGPSSVAQLISSGTGATLSGSGTVVITESLNWSTSLKGTGSIVIAPGATAAGGPSIYRTFINEGTFNLNKGTAVREGALFENIGIFNATASVVITDESTTGTFVNRGTFEKTSSTGVTNVNVGFVNQGIVEAQTGTLEFSKGGGLSVGGDWLEAEGALLKFTRGVFELAGGTLEGTVWVTQATTVRLEEDVEPVALSLVIAGTRTAFAAYPSTVEVLQNELHLKSLSLTQDYIGTLTGPGTVTIAESLYWTGTMSGSGSTVLLPGATATVKGNTLSERTFVNGGTVTLPTEYMQIKEGAHFRNAGTFIVMTQTGSLGPSGSNAEFLNLGTFEKTTGTGKTIVYVPFASTGTIEQRSGQLEFKKPIHVKASTATSHRAKCKDPVDCATGNFAETQTDLSIGGRGVGIDLTRTYSAESAAAGTLGIFGYGWTNSFGATLTSEEGGAMETLTDASGETTTFTKSGIAWIAPSWSRSLLTGSAESGFTLTLPSQVRQKFSGSGRLESVTDRNGNETTLAYNGSEKLETITDPSGRKITLTYNGEGLVEKAKDPMGHEVKYAYESKQLKSVTLPGEASAELAIQIRRLPPYDLVHRRPGRQNHQRIRRVNQVTAQTDPAERKTTWGYEGFHTKITNKATGAVTDEWFNSNNQPISITRGFGTASATTESFTYTAGGLLASKTDGNGHTTTYGYDEAGIGPPKKTPKATKRNGPSTAPISS